MTEDIEVRPLSSLDDVRAASALIDRVWGERRIVGAPLLRGTALHGGQVLGAFHGAEMIGAQVGFVGLTEDGPVLHSHITGVLAEWQHRGVGFLLKTAQREWCLVRGIRVVTWTFDPMVARNARFNLHRLGAVADRFHRDYYGPMEDAFNRGDRSDRLEIRWELESPRVVAAVKGQPEDPDVGRAEVVVDDQSGMPRVRRVTGAEALLVRVPADYHAFRARDPERARAWRDAVADALEDAFSTGYRAVGFLREGAYVLRRG